MNGFRIYKNLLSPTEIVSFEKPVPQRSESEDIMDIVFAVDPLTGFPATSIGQYLSDNVADSVRSFIERKILIDLPQGESIIPDGLRESVRHLDPDFQINCMRERFESIEEYEERMTKYLKSLEDRENSTATYKKVTEKLREKGIIS